MFSTNTFYSAFDTACLDEQRKDDYRTPFEQDRDRIIHTSAFRRLQAKTQVFLSGEYDFYRTRLTHSLEVAQIGRAICTYLQRTSPLLSPEHHIDPHLVEAVCLSHDLGHPPFGHAGERTLNQLMRNHGGFEGNAQTLRMLTETVYSERGERKGMSPTRAFVDGVLKYKTLYAELPDPVNHYVYDDQRRFLEFVFDGFDVVAALPAGKTRDAFRSIECQVMDWADDVAYSLNDVVDGIHSGFITMERIERWAAGQSLGADHQRSLERLFAAMKEGYAERSMSAKIGKYITACTLRETENPMSARTNRYRYELVIDPAARTESKLFKRMALDLVFLSPQLNQVEKKGDFMLRRIFESFRENYINKERFEMHLLPASYEQGILASPDASHRVRLICDYIAGMTDGFAIRTYKRLFDPDFGSLADLV